jgi:hypothetical protein
MGSTPGDKRARIYYLLKDQGKEDPAKDLTKETIHQVVVLHKMIPAHLMLLKVINHLKVRTLTSMSM